MRRIAVGGSCANPPHNGHKQLLIHVLHMYNLFDKVIWIPTGDRTDKITNNVHPDHRIAMTELLIEQNWKIGIDSLPLLIKYDEIYEEAKTTWERLNLLKENYPKDEIVWFTGSDSDIFKWYKGEELVKNNKFLVIQRKGYLTNQSKIRVSVNHINSNDTELKTGINLELTDKPIDNISSTEIKKLISEGKYYGHLVPYSIYQYIEQNKLYR